MSESNASLPSQSEDLAEAEEEEFDLEEDDTATVSSETPVMTSRQVI